MSDPRILLLGPPGAGKGTQSRRLAEHFDIEHVSTGDILRENPDLETAHGTPRDYMEAGELVPDPVMEAVVEEALSGRDGYVLDGYPRNRSQAEFLSGITDFDLIVLLTVPEEELVARLAGRRVCPDCGTNYHVEYDQPEVAGVCDACGGELIQREDDTEDTVRERLRVYEESTRPMLEYYADEPTFHEVDGDRSPAAVWESLRALVETATASS